MTTNNLSEKDKTTTEIVLVNAIELVGQILTEIAGNDISTTINNQPLTRKVAYEYAATIIGSTLKTKIGNF